MNVLADALEDVGFVVTDRNSADSLEKIIGYRPQRSPARLELPIARGVVLRDALYFLASSSIVCTTQLRSVVSVWIWAALLRRDALSIPQCIFGFLEKFIDCTVAWWPSARREAKSMADVVPWLFADPGAPLCPVIMATDAMGASDVDDGGWGFVARDASQDLVSACFCQGSAIGRTIARLDGNAEGVKYPDRALKATIPFSLLPADLFVEDSWVLVDKGRWKGADHITLGEGRAVNKMLDVVTASCLFHRLKIISLQDNQPIAGSYMKGRSPAAALNRLCRKKAARLLACGSRLILPWCESRRMPADEASRTL